VSTESVLTVSHVPARVLAAEVGDMHLSKKVFIFRSVQRHSSSEAQNDEDIEIGAEEGGTDPFAPPKASETSALHVFVQSRFQELEAKIDALANRGTPESER
jgi:hypothetical protein